MLYKALLSMINRGKTEDLGTKIDVFYAAGKLTHEEYEDLASRLPKE